MVTTALCGLLAGCDAGRSETGQKREQNKQSAGEALPRDTVPLQPKKAFQLSGVVSSQLAPLTLADTDYLLLASELRGLVLLNEKGEEVAALDGGKVERFALQSQRDDRWLVAAYDEATSEIQLRQLQVDSTTGLPALGYLGAVSAAPQAALCFARRGERTHLFAIDESGLGREFIVHPRERAWQFIEVRPLYFGEQVSGCAVDDERDQLLVAQPPLGIWSLNADAELDEERRVFAAGDALGEEFAGLWLNAAARQLWLIGDAEVRAFDLGAELPQRQPVFSRALADLEPVSAAWQGGQLLALEEESDVVQRFDAELPQPKSELQAIASPQQIPNVPANAQTQPVASGGDAADDPAIWLNPNNATGSLILGTDKKSGLNVYDLSGKLRAQFPVGRVNNVDLRRVNHPRYDALAAASNRTTPGISLFGITRDGGVEDLGLREMDLDDPYGLCLYSQGDKTFAWMSDKDGNLHLGQIILGDDAQQWKLAPRANLQVASQVEGCVVDDEREVLFFGEEDAGVWRLDIAAFLAGDAKPQLVARVDGEKLVADVEGMGLYHNGEQSYLVVSSQGNNSYALFSRDGSRFIGHFRVDANLDKGIDGSSETDGLDVTSTPLGAAYPQGLLIVQDGRNRMPSEAQNFKLVSWADIATSLNLP